VHEGERILNVGFLIPSQSAPHMTRTNCQKGPDVDVGHVEPQTDYLSYEEFINVDA
jgi:hypothetical protein